MNIKDKMNNIKLYVGNDDELIKEQTKCLDKQYEYNQTRPTEVLKRIELLKEMFASIGDNCYIEPPLHANWGGKNVYIGKNVYANFNLTLVDDTKITIGDYTMIGPNVVIATAGHPIDPDLRKKGYQFNAPINIGSNCWLGAGVIVLPGVNIGDNTVVGAGSVVTKDLPSNVVAVGNPARVLREITLEDKIYYYKKLKIEDIE